MADNAVYGYIFNGNCYALPFPSLASPDSGLADEFVKLVKMGPQFKTWLADAEAHFRQKEARLERAGYKLTHSLSFIGRHSQWPAPPHALYPWTYILDLDRRIFTVHGTAHFRLDNIPRNWFKYLHMHKWLRFWTLDPRLPLEYIPDVSGPPPIPRSYIVNAYNRAEYEEDCKLQPTVPHNLPVLQRTLMLEFFRRFAVAERLRDINVAPDTPEFQKLAYGILVLAAWGSFDLRRHRKPNSTSSHRFGRQYTSYCESNAFHPSGCRFYKFRSIMVFLASHLDQADNFKAAIVEFVRNGRFYAHNFEGIAFSIRGLVYIRVNSQKVTHTALLPLWTSPSALYSSWEDDTSRYPGFVLLQRLLTDPWLSTPSSTGTVLPNELVQAILAQTDNDTYRECRNVSLGFRSITLPPRIGDFTVVDYKGRGVFGMKPNSGKGKVQCVALKFLEDWTDIPGREYYAVHTQSKSGAWACLRPKDRYLPRYWETMNFEPFYLDFCVPHHESRETPEDILDESNMEEEREEEGGESPSRETKPRWWVGEDGPFSDCESCDEQRDDEDYGSEGTAVD